MGRILLEIGQKNFEPFLSKRFLLQEESKLGAFYEKISKIGFQILLKITEQVIFKRICFRKDCGTCEVFGSDV
ncbi:hypothetical protein CH380_00955 [Leptospira adleri]|uniref:Uncharacterized protein n=1 Tax=Leptospira adleri TaxID=2023186 RepID=A0A2M9YUA0_9LEPT|nr:hypothetical protein CH380_00955 [Leptospira adleri]PJZ63820.1 hypothetical protein CH376_01510 [Leptospira adleri]